MTAAFQFTYKMPSGDFYAIQPTPEFSAWLSANDNLGDMLWQAATRSTAGALSDLTFSMFVKDLRHIRINRLVYPEGGVLNWGYAFMLFTGKQVSDIKADDHGVGKLLMQASPVGQLEFDGFRLAASIPIAEVGKGTSGQPTGRITTVSDQELAMHLCLIVDERFYASNYSDAAYTQAYITPESWTWDLIIQSAAETCGLGTVSVPTANSRYGKPSMYSDMIEVTQAPAAEILDAALVNTGRVLIRNPNGDYTINTILSSYTAENSTTLSGYTLRAGGEWNQNGRSNYFAALPSNVKCYFPAYSVGNMEWATQYDSPSSTYGSSNPSDFHLRSPINNVLTYPITISIASAFDDIGISLVSGLTSGTKLFRCYSKATVATGAGGVIGPGAPPSNNTSLTNLAMQIADDFYVRRLSSLTCEVWNDLVKPTGTGLNTYIYDFGPECCTHIVSNEANGTEYEQMMQDTDSSLIVGPDYITTDINGSNESGLSFASSDTLGTQAFDPNADQFAGSPSIVISRAGMYQLSLTFTITATVASSASVAFNLTITNSGGTSTLSQGANIPPVTGGGASVTIGLESIIAIAPGDLNVTLTAAVIGTPTWSGNGSLTINRIDSNGI